MQDTYKRKQPNDLTLGPVFEDMVLLYLFLNLKHGQALAREVIEPSKFDDVVLREMANNGKYEYSFYQLKHKDTLKNTGHHQSITWKDLLTNFKKDQFSLKKYYDSYLAMSQTYKSDVKELAFVTTLGFSKKQSADNKPQDLEKLAKNLKSQDSQTTYDVTVDDLVYFEEINNKGFGKTDGKCYKLSKLGVDEIHKSLTSTFIITNNTELKMFLQLVVFYINQPHVNELKKINESILRLYFPFYLDALRQKDTYDHLEKMVLELFKPVQENNAANAHQVNNLKAVPANWVKVGSRHSVFERLIEQYKKNVSLGSVKGYETLILKNTFKDLKFQGLLLLGNKMTFHTKILRKSFRDLKKGWKDQEPLSIINIYDTNKSHPTVITLKIMKYLKNSSIRNRALIVKLHDTDAFGEIILYFKNLEKDVSIYGDVIVRKFRCIIEASSRTVPSEKMNKSIEHLTDELSKLKDLRKWIQFVIVTQNPIREQEKTRACIHRVEDVALQWDHLPDATKSYLFKKTLVDEYGSKMSLEALGFHEEHLDWLDSVSLAELIIHDDKSPSLRLKLPCYDDSLKQIYIDRQLKLPYINIDSIHDEHLRKRLIFSEEDYNRELQRGPHMMSDEKMVYHLLKPLKDFIPMTPKSEFLWSKSSTPNGFQELMNRIRRSRDSEHTVPESVLLADQVHLGVGSEDCKLAIIVDLPGKGKSFLLTSLANQHLKALETEPSSKFIRLLYLVNLPECRHISSEGTIVVDAPTAVDFLVNKLIGLETNERLNLSATIVKNMCLNEHSASVFLLLDGFDEISEADQAIIMKMIDFLLVAKGIKRIILASRPDCDLGTKLEMHFKQAILHLTDFDERQQENFLVQSWKLKLMDNNLEINEITKQLVREFAKALVVYARRALLAEDKTFLDIPLQCMIVSECFFDELKKYLHLSASNSSEKLLPPEFDSESFELLRLYRRFVKTKFKILFQEKAKLRHKNENLLLLKRELIRHLTDALKRLAVYHMMKDLRGAEVLCRLPWHRYRKSQYATDLRLAMKLGMIRGMQVMMDQESPSHCEAPRVKFIHRTFAEYFFAKFLLDHFTEEDSELLDSYFLVEDIRKQIYKAIVDEVLIKGNYAGIRRFFSRMLSQHLPLQGDQCLFSIEGREKILTTWPLISHREFNSFLAEWVQMVSKENIEKLKSNNIDLSSIHSSYPPTVFADMLNTNASTMARMLLLCLKEYDSRPSVPHEEREMLAYVAIFHLARWKDPNMCITDSSLLVALLQWFDSGCEEQNLSPFFLQLIKCVVESVRIEVLGLACSMLDRHREKIPEYNNELKAVTRSIFMNETLLLEFTSYYFARSSHSGFQSITRIFKLRSKYFKNILTMCKLILPDTSLLDDLLVWFHGQLNTNYWDSLMQEEERSINPFTLCETANFIITTFRDQNSKASEELYERYFEFLIEMFALLLKNQEESKMKNIPEKKRIKLENKLRLWLFMFSNDIVTNPKNASSYKLFHTEIGNRALNGFVSFKCCKEENEELKKTGFFQICLEMRETLEQWLEKKLEELWHGEGETKFIDFLFTQHSPSPCLLFSGLISSYIPERLTELGLEYFIETIKRVTVQGSESTLWDAIMQETIVDGFKHSFEEVQELKKLMGIPVSLTANPSESFSWF